MLWGRDNVGLDNVPVPEGLVPPGSLMDEVVELAEGVFGLLETVEVVDVIIPEDGLDGGN